MQNVGLAFTRGSSLKNSEDSYVYFFYVYGFTQFCAIFLLFSVDIHPLLCKWSFILVDQTFARFSRSFLWPMNLSLKTVMSIMRVG